MLSRVCHSIHRVDWSSVGQLAQVELLDLHFSMIDFFKNKVDQLLMFNSLVKIVIFIVHYLLNCLFI